MGYLAFVLDSESRDLLLSNYTPKHEHVIAHHVTLMFGVTKDQVDEFNLDNEIDRVLVTGYGDHGGVDCVTVTTRSHGDTQPNGTKFHVTLSCAEGVKPVAAKFAAEVAHELNCCSLILTGTVEYCQ